MESLFNSANSALTSIANSSDSLFHAGLRSHQLTPPQPRARAKSLPVPRGKTPTAGCVSKCN